jgi:ankyrin repeat protein
MQHEKILLGVGVGVAGPVAVAETPATPPTLIVHAHQSNQPCRVTFLSAASLEARKLRRIHTTLGCNTTRPAASHDWAATAHTTAAPAPSVSRRNAADRLGVCLEATMADDDNPLVRALFQGRCIRVIRWIVDDTPHWLRLRDGEGRLPIHRLFEIKPLPDIGIVQYMVRKWPESVRKWTSTGSLPIHLACAYSSSLDVLDEEVADVVRTLVETFPQSVLEKDANGQLPLHLACTDIDSFGYYAPDDVPYQLDLIEVLAQAAPESCRETNAHGRLPLHCALMCITPFRCVLEYLIGAYPQALQEPDHGGMIPLHHAVSVAAWNEDDFRFLVEQFPESVRVLDRKGRLPLHHLDEYASVEMVQVLVEQFPESLLVQDDAGHLPLHRAIICNGSDRPEVVQFLVERSPQSARVKAKDGSLPLFLAIQGMRYRRMKIIRCLVQAWPESLQEKSTNGLTPLLMAASTKAKLSLIYYLATQDFEAFRRRNLAADTPAVET